eukprot:jgi/Chrpa1/27883/Chrysochromulina_OHIO_Genome00008624-RA
MRAVSAAAAACAAATARAKEGAVLSANEGALPVAALLEALNTALLGGSRTAALLGGGSGGACEGGGADGPKYGALARPKYGSPTRRCCSDGCDGSAGDGRQSGGSRAEWRWELERDACAALERDACAAIGGTAAALWNGCPELRFVNCRTSSWERVSSRREGSMLWWRGGWGKTTSTIPSRGQSRSRSAPVALSSRPGPAVAAHAPANCDLVVEAAAGQAAGQAAGRAGGGRRYGPGR